MSLHRAFISGAAVALTFLIMGCSGPKDTPLPKELDKLETIKPAIEKLSQEDKDLLMGYIMRNTLAAAFSGLTGGQQKAGIPDGMTIGNAIEEQKKWKADAAQEEVKQAALKAKLKAEQDTASAAMRNAVTTTIISKRISTEHGYSGIVMDEKLTVKFGFKNNTDKEISGVKGTLEVNDIFGDYLCGFNISYDTTIKPGESATWIGERSVKYGRNEANDRKFSELEDDKYKVTWNPKAVIFKDGTKLTLPKEE